MKTFNKSLIAALVASMSTYAAADVGDFTDADSGAFVANQSTAWVSAQGIATGNTSVVHNGGSFEFNNAKALNETDRFLITVSGTEFALDANTAFDAGSNAAGDVFATAGTSTVGTAQLTSLNSLAVPITLTGTDLEASAAEAIITLNALKLNMSEAALGSKVQVTVEAQKDLGSNVFTTIDSVSGTLATVVNQLALNVATGDSANKDITASDRLSFTTGAGVAAYQDGFDLTIVDQQVQYVPVTGQGDYTLSIESDFGFLDQDGDGEVDGTVSISADNGTLAIAEDFQSLTVKAAAAAIDGDGTGISEGIDFTFDGEREIPELSASAKVAYSYKGAQAPTTANYSDSVGVISWDLEGTPGSFSYMPYGDNISQILFVTNNESNDAAITVTAHDENGEKFGPVALSKTAKGNAVTKITGEVKEALMAAGFSGKGAIKLDISVNSGDVEYYGAYNVGGSDRGYVEAK